MALLERPAPQNLELKADSHFLSPPMASMVADAKSISLDLDPVRLVTISLLFSPDVFFRQFQYKHLHELHGTCPVWVYSIHKYAYSRLMPNFFIFLHNKTSYLDLEQFTFLLSIIGVLFSFMMLLWMSYSRDNFINIWFQSFPVVSEEQSAVQKRKKWYKAFSLLILYIKYIMSKNSSCI